jgi:hypothetical protein
VHGDKKSPLVLIDQADVIGSESAYRQLTKLLSPKNTTKTRTRGKQKQRTLESGVVVFDDGGEREGIIYIFHILNEHY